MNHGKLCVLNDTNRKIAFQLKERLDLSHLIISYLPIPFSYKSIQKKRQPNIENSFNLPSYQYRCTLLLFNLKSFLADFPFLSFPKKKYPLIHRIVLFRYSFRPPHYFYLSI